MRASSVRDGRLPDDGAHDRARRARGPGADPGIRRRNRRLLHRLGGRADAGRSARRVSALRAALEPTTKVGFHAHNNLGLGVGNTLVAIDHGAELVDASTRGLGAGAGNCATEALVAACDKLGIDLGVSVPKIADVAEDVVGRLIPVRPEIDRASLMLGWAGVYSSFLLHAERASARYGVPTADILVELGRLKAVGGQEDMIMEVAIRLAEHDAAQV